MSISHSFTNTQNLPKFNPHSNLPKTSPLADTLTNSDRDEVLTFLDKRPLHTVMLTGMVRDNGMTSPYNRGTFYGYRNSANKLEGVALIGHLVMLEADTNVAKKALAEKAQEFKNAHLIVGEKQRINQFWRYYSTGGQEMRFSSNELLFELKSSNKSGGEAQIRRATLADLDLIIPAQVHLNETENHFNPRIVDFEGFRRRCANRIENGKTWVLIENGELIFKTDVMVATNELTYLEGVYVNSRLRGQGHGTKCLSKLCQELLTHTKSVCLLVRESNTTALSFYKKIGFQLSCLYQSIFLHKLQSVG